MLGAVLLEAMLAGCSGGPPPARPSPLQAVSESAVQLPFSVRVAVQGFELQGIQHLLLLSGVRDKDTFKQSLTEYLKRRRTFREVMDGPADLTLGVKAKLKVDNEGLFGFRSDASLQAVLMGPEGAPLGRYSGESTGNISGDVDFGAMVHSILIQAMDDLLSKVEEDHQAILAKAGKPPSSEMSAKLPPVAAPGFSSIPASDVDDPPTARVKASARAHAVVIGIEQYQQKLPKADFAAHDAEIMGLYLTKTLGYAEENVVVLLNDRATKTGVEKYIEGWLPDRVEKEDAVFVYFSGHGAPNPKTGKAFLVPYDGDPAFVDQTGYPLDRLYDRLAALPAREVVVMLDSCFSGAGGRSVIAKGMRPMVLSVENPVLAKGKVVVLAASSGSQVSSTYDQKSHGLLTYFFLKGLRGEADRNQDGRVDLGEVFEYLKPQVERTARREFHNEQTPQLLGNPDLLRKGIRLVERANP
jgi:hypothetical protein